MFQKYIYTIVDIVRGWWPFLTSTSIRVRSFAGSQIGSNELRAWKYLSATAVCSISLHLFLWNRSSKSDRLTRRSWALNHLGGQNRIGERQELEIIKMPHKLCPWKRVFGRSRRSKNSFVDYAPFLCIFIDETTQELHDARLQLIGCLWRQRLFAMCWYLY